MSGLGTNQEIYSWPGESIFSSEDLGKLVGHGFLGTGFFAGFPRNLFLSNAAIVGLASEQGTGGHTDRFTYTTSSLTNHWIVNWLGAKGTVGESGEFWVDENSRALVRLRAIAREIPPQLPLKEFAVSITYQTLHLNARSVLLPSSAELIAVEWNGTSHINSIGYSQCHVFEAESKVSDSGETLVKAVENYEGIRDVLPGGLDITIKLENGIRGDTARIGDLITARAVKAVRHAGHVIVPQDAIVKGRIREFRRLPDLPYAQVGIEFNEIEMPGHVSTFFAHPVNLPLGIETALSRGTTPPMHAAGSISSGSIAEKISLTEIPGVATFFIGGLQTVPKGFQMTWRTQRQRHP